jgi:hypothetical protein
METRCCEQLNIAAKMVILLLYAKSWLVYLEHDKVVNITDL